MKKYILISIIVIIFIAGCFNNQDKQFKNTAKNLKVLLLELQNVNIGEDVIKDEKGRTIVILNYDTKAAFIKQRERDFKRIADSLKDYSTRNSNSIWSDDADFLNTIVYLSISLPGNGMYSEAVRSIKYFLDKYPTFTIEEWTKKYFSDITLFYLFDKNKIAFDFSPYIELSKLQEEDRIKAFFEFHVVYEYLKGDDLISAEKEYERIKNTSKYEWLTKTLREVIDEYKKRSSNKGTLVN